jgi:hypothetical protein
MAELRAAALGLPIGSQTYPHRQRIKGGDFAGLCKDMAELGVGSLELCSTGDAEFASLADGKTDPKNHRSLHVFNTELAATPDAQTVGRDGRTALQLCEYRSVPEAIRTSPGFVNVWLS